MARALCEERTSHERLWILQLDACRSWFVLKIFLLPVLQNAGGKVGWRSLSFILSLTKCTSYTGAETETRVHLVFSVVIFTEREKNW